MRVKDGKGKDKNGMRLKNERGRNEKVGGENGRGREARMMVEDEKGKDGENN